MPFIYSKSCSISKVSQHSGRNETLTSCICKLLIHSSLPTQCRSEDKLRLFDLILPLRLRFRSPELPPLSFLPLLEDFLAGE
mmetsp:Transcript_5245/g.11387  ORF Transcript_5245/g.11387 Transcript_5245/m.11387 type:complete len:82 (-) Transcript_5245:1883-2128(-)